MIELPLLLDYEDHPDFNLTDHNKAFEIMRKQNQLVTGILNGSNEVDELLENLLENGTNPDDYIQFGVSAIERVMSDPYLLNQ